MADWTQSMQQTFEYYTVDPGTWKDVKRITTVTSSSISRDWNTDTLGSASFNITENIGEVYLRIYLVTVQNGITERHPLGTYLVQTADLNFDGLVTSNSFDGYTPLIELKEKRPPLGYYSAKDANIMDEAYRLTEAGARAPVVKATAANKLYSDFVANTDDTWCTYISDLIANAKFYFDLDELGRILFSPKQDMAALQPVWTYTDDNSSILQGSIKFNRDLYGIPNVVEVVYSDENNYYYARVVNDDENSLISTVNRGREIPYRDTNPSFSGEPTQAMVDEYAQQLLRDLSTVECTISYTHGHNGVRIGDCVRMDYTRSGLTDIKARVVQQDITCTPGCSVSETATFTQKFWR